MPEACISRLWIQTTGYKYAHDYPNHYVRQQYLPDAFKDQKFYHMGDLGYEKEMKEHMRRIRGDESDEE